MAVDTRYFFYGCVPASLFEDHFYRFGFVKRCEKQAFLQAGAYHLEAELWVSSHAGASHPYGVTLGSGLARWSWCRTKRLACVREAWCGANCPSQVHQSIVEFSVWLLRCAHPPCVSVKCVCAALMSTGCELVIVFCHRPRAVRYSYL